MEVSARMKLLSAEQRELIEEKRDELPTILGLLPSLPRPALSEILEKYMLMPMLSSRASRTNACSSLLKTPNWQNLMYSILRVSSDQRPLSDEDEKKLVALTMSLFGDVLLYAFLQHSQEESLVDINAVIRQSVDTLDDSFGWWPQVASLARVLLHSLVSKMSKYARHLRDELPPRGFKALFALGVAIEEFVLFRPTAVPAQPRLRKGLLGINFAEGKCLDLPLVLRFVELLQQIQINELDKFHEERQLMAGDDKNRRAKPLRVRGEIELAFFENLAAWLTSLQQNRRSQSRIAWLARELPKRPVSLATTNSKDTERALVGIYESIECWFKHLSAISSAAAVATDIMNDKRADVETVEDDTDGSVEAGSSSASMRPQPPRKNSMSISFTLEGKKKTTPKLSTRTPKLSPLPQVPPTPKLTSKPKPVLAPQETGVWRTAKDPASGLLYYWRTDTREVSWRRPPSLMSARALCERGSVASKRAKDF
ncbi:MAG: hypothetical protein MHM6MM_007108 [Cercozoa sp. M6MM]